MDEQLVHAMNLQLRHGLRRSHCRGDLEEPPGADRHDMWESNGPEGMGGGLTHCGVGHSSGRGYGCHVRRGRRGPPVAAGRSCGGTPPFLARDGRPSLLAGRGHGRGPPSLGRRGALEAPPCGAGAAGASTFPVGLSHVALARCADVVRQAQEPLAQPGIDGNEEGHRLDLEVAHRHKGLLEQLHVDPWQRSLCSSHSCGSNTRLCSLPL
mmetsp:Transcript_40051/g.127458  ORF Transcript_40051/g.127458 Transcript_40051/m.127458 type:complete len:210 (+) Transcript_40051:707-1336(+)